MTATSSKVNALNRIEKYLVQPVSILPLITLRVVFGVLMAFSILRVALNGWIDWMYVRPDFHFKYYGLHWITDLGEFDYVLFAIAFITSITTALGYKYRLSILLFFLSFTYIELIDKSYYLNHYYFISLLSFVLIFMPLGNPIHLSNKTDKITSKCPRYMYYIVLSLICVLYFYAGLAKVNSDWLYRAMPMKIWLNAKDHLPIIGSFLNEEWVAYAFSYAGALFDLTIWVFLLWTPTKYVAYLVVVIFHLSTALLFPSIGMFPFMMIGITIVFLPLALHEKVWSGRFLRKLFFGQMMTFPSNYHRENIIKYQHKFCLFLFGVFLFIQVCLPLRYLLYPGELFWTEQGYRFSWRVMLMEKAGFASFMVRDSTGKRIVVNNSDFLNATQEKQMSFQPDMIAEFGQYLCACYRKKWKTEDVQVYVDNRVSLNGRSNQRMVSDTADLCKIKRGWHHKTWILESPDEIQAL